MGGGTHDMMRRDNLMGSGNHDFKRFENPLIGGDDHDDHDTIDAEIT
jgi:hypothetical protein